MKVTVDIPDDVYRQVKAKSALEGWAVREVATTLFRAWVAAPAAAPPEAQKAPAGKKEPADPPWFGGLRAHAPRAKGLYDMEAIRRSIARGRTGEDRP
ncbi:MAG: hypothetical protein R6X19_02875 [Kiritimatiellia bacterium]